MRVALGSSGCCGVRRGMAIMVVIAIPFWESVVGGSGKISPGWALHLAPLPDSVQPAVACPPPLVRLRLRGLRTMCLLPLASQVHLPLQPCRGLRQGRGLPRGRLGTRSSPSSLSGCRCGACKLRFPTVHMHRILGRVHATSLAAALRVLRAHLVARPPLRRPDRWHRGSGRPLVARLGRGPSRLLATLAARSRAFTPAGCRRCILSTPCGLGRTKPLPRLSCWM
mmetsp:Transcript_111034/g.313126  ORF Transcript_111034/g.313126 Transcript_111034/m.313126 type:complete len:225 (+) Transcript_111034:67-741(+)